MKSYTGAKVFTADEVLAVCQDIQNKFGLDGPLNEFKKI
jgi:hypothetical protein